MLVVSEMLNLFDCRNISGHTGVTRIRSYFKKTMSYSRLKTDNSDLDDVLNTVVCMSRSTAGLE